MHDTFITIKRRGKRNIRLVRYNELYHKINCLRGLFFCGSTMNNSTKKNKMSATSVCPLPKQYLSYLNNKPSNWSPSSKTWLRLVKSVFSVCSPSTLSLISNGTTEDSACEKAECLNLVFPTPHSWFPSFPVIPNCSWTLCLLHLRKWRRFFQPSTLTLLRDWMASAHAS